MTECAWVKQITPEDGAKQRWTQGEKRQVLSHNIKVQEFCR